MTELAPVATLLSTGAHDDPSPRRSCGRAAAHARGADPVAGRQPVERGDVDEITVRGDHVMSGYWNKPEETRTGLSGGWMHTGDADCMDERGYVSLGDRIKDMVITGGRTSTP
jgi:long-subunit acyl-CoA synthetase (AMP-forming)